MQTRPCDLGKLQGNSFAWDAHTLQGPADSEILHRKLLPTPSRLSQGAVSLMKSLSAGVTIFKKKKSPIRFSYTGETLKRFLEMQNYLAVPKLCCTLNSWRGSLRNTVWRRPRPPPPSSPPRHPDLIGLALLPVHQKSLKDVPGHFYVQRSWRATDLLVKNLDLESNLPALWPWA